MTIRHRSRWSVALALIVVAFASIGVSAASDSPAESPSAMVQLPTLSEGSHLPLPPMVIPSQPAQPDRRPVWVGGGIVVVAALLWWNRRRRAEWERPER